MDFDDDFESLSEWESGSSIRRYKDSAIGTRSAIVFRWESPAERYFAETIAKTVHGDIDFRPGTNVTTSHGVFRPDMILESESQMIGLEVDGKPYHQDPHRDVLRDSLLLLTKNLVSIYRFAASATIYNPWDCLYILMNYERRLFDVKATEYLIPKLASPWVRRIDSFPRSGVSVFPLALDLDIVLDDDWDSEKGEENRNPIFFRVDRHALSTPEIQRTAKWIGRVSDRLGPIPFPLLLERYRHARSKAAS